MSDIKIEYFIDYWRDLTHKHNSIENELVHSILYNPRELFKEFTEEIERKNLKNSDNKKFFIDKTNEFEKLDIEALNFIRPTLKLIKQQFSKKDDFSYLVHLLKIGQLKLDNFTLAKEAVQELAVNLTDESNIDTMKIKHLVNIIIFELLHKKYSFETISKIIDNIFSTYRELPRGILDTDFPHKIECKNWDVKSHEYKEYEKELKNHIDNLTKKERILALNNLFNKEAQELKFVFQIKGLRGDDVNIHIGDVQIYNPKRTRLFKNPTNKFDELFTEEEKKDNFYYCNGAVTLNVLDSEFAKEEAIQILENTLDLIASRYIDYKTPLTINKFQHYVIDKEGNPRGGGATSTWEYFTYQDSLELDNSKYDSFIYSKPIHKDTILEIDKKILESMHWKRKAVESNENNEKILWHWVALENIFERQEVNTPKTIFEVVSKLLTKKYMYSFAWKHYHKLREITASTAPLHHYRLQLNLPNKLKNQIGLNIQEGETIHLKNFIDNLDNIQAQMDTDTLFYEQLEYLKNIFTDEKNCIGLVDNFEKIFYEQLVYIYRVRNKIVHNAYNESNLVLQSYVEFIALVSSVSINMFIGKRAELSLKTNDDIINNIIYDYDEFRLELKEKGTKILLNN